MDDLDALGLLGLDPRATAVIDLDADPRPGAAQFSFQNDAWKRLASTDGVPDPAACTPDDLPRSRPQLVRTHGAW
ncbi:hypothetical protein ANO11243_009710 [Dothideomycetidae sp. 11243]|nr:hypothetical protein ANO11243_009710 [fungal sp. No.11243]